MKKNLFYLMAIGLVIAFTSCDKDDDGGDDGNNNVTDQFSTLGIEGDKAKIQEEGLKMLDEMKAMEKEPVIDYNVSFMNYLDMADPFANNPNFSNNEMRKNSVFRVVYTLAAVKQHGSEVLFDGLKSAAAEDPETLSEAWDMIKGIYTWNFETESWDFEATGNDLVINFPSTEAGTTNNAQYKVTYKGESHSFSIEEESYTGEVPTEFTATLTVDTAVAFKYEFAATYVDESIPTSISSIITFGKYKYGVTFTNTTNSKMDLVYFFESGTSTLMKWTMGATGNWTKANIQSQIDKEEFAKILSKATIGFEVFGIKLEGEVNYANIEQKIIDADNGNYYEDSVKMQTLVDALNANTTMNLKYVSDNKIIAKGEFYVDFYEDYYWEYNEETGEYKEVIEKEYEPNIRLVFADKTTSDLETYFENGFDNLDNELEKFFQELEDNYGLNSDDEEVK